MIWNFGVDTVASKDELHENEVVKKHSKIVRGKKSNLMGERFVVLPGVVRIYIIDNNATNSSSDEKENLQGEKSKRHKRICKEIIIRSGKIKVTSKMISSKEKKIQNISKKMVAIEIKGANTVTNIIEPPPKESNPIHQ
ncbi:hypothetical protein H5410_000776 [Solanum commersonii]|uniref:Uncharacterized protein n=1 Tax=Solanum commersonii TaxID=4109 RepID=A0A9J6AXV6_SOLCO|nr:hypothetical protein H5410_000776 [Solanum commersonii]